MYKYKTQYNLWILHEKKRNISILERRVFLNEFEKWLQNKGMSKNTVRTYCAHLKGYQKWFEDNFDSEFKILYRENVLDYISYMLNIDGLSGNTINLKLAALKKYNLYSISKEHQTNMTIFKEDFIKIQISYIDPNTVTKKEVEAFRQKVLENDSNRNYAIVTLLAYSGMRVSEALNLKLSDVDFIGREIMIRYSKRKKQRIAIINDKIVNSMREYFKEREKKKYRDSDYVFISQKAEKINQSTVNKLFNKFSDNITPHTLRHFFCSYALENGWSAYEVAAQVGHSNIHTTMLYTHPSKTDMKEKSNRL